MRFSQQGANVPERLVRAHEEGRVVFFCGAGISINAGLCDFPTLTKKIYHTLGFSAVCPQFSADSPAVSPDTALNDLQRKMTTSGTMRFAPARKRIVEALDAILKPDLSKPNALTVHQSILALSQDRKGKTRLVTTNFDRLFEEASKAENLPQIATCAAPLLPVPKRSVWNSIVHLHGALPDQETRKSSPEWIHNLVLTSADFGRAYINERWAARFVSELFRNFTVCFVGYSVSDPVMRYMVDALSAERALSDTGEPAFAFVASEPQKMEQTRKEWQDRGIEPLIYPSSDSADHAALGETLSKWAAYYRDFEQKKRLVTDAMQNPNAMTQEDIDTALWALFDDSGRVMQKFAHNSPAPPFEWLDIIAKHASDQSLLSSRTGDLRQHRNLITPFAAWLCRHIEDERLLKWLVLDRSRLNRGGILSDFERMLWKNRENIKCPRMKKLWRLFLIGRIQPGSPEYFHLPWNVNSFGLGLDREFENADEQDLPILWEQLFDKIKPCIAVSAAGGLELSVACHNVADARGDITKSCLPHARFHHLTQMESCLRTAIELDALVNPPRNDAGKLSSNWVLPSIAKHPDNQIGRHSTLAALICLTRDMWTELHAQQKAKAATINLAKQWGESDHAIFHRLALFAAGEFGCISPRTWAGWLTRNNGAMLQDNQTRREISQLFLRQGSRLGGQYLRKIEKAILKPVRAMLNDDFSLNSDVQSAQTGSAYLAWILLKKLQQGGARLSDNANRFIQSYESQHPNARCDEEEFSPTRFSPQMRTDGWGPLWEDNPCPRKKSAIIAWIKDSDQGHDSYEALHRRAKRHFLNVGFAVCEVLKTASVAELENYGTEFLAAPFYAWRGKERLVGKIWRYLGETILQIPAQNLHAVRDGLAAWLSEVAGNKYVKVDDSVFLPLCERFARAHGVSHAISHGVDMTEFARTLSLTRAINHSLGHLATAMLTRFIANFSGKTDPKELSDDYTRLFDVFFQSEYDHFAYGRIVLASRLNLLFFMDPDWTSKNLLPRFEWRHVESRAMWEAFLWSPGVTWDLLGKLKPAFVEFPLHISEIAESSFSRVYADLVFHAFLLDKNGLFTDEEYLAIIKNLPSEYFAQLVSRLAAAFSDRDKPDGEGHPSVKLMAFLDTLMRAFPQLAAKTEGISHHNSIIENLCILCLRAGSDFPRVLSQVDGCLKPVRHARAVPDELNKDAARKIAQEHPAKLLSMLGAIIDENTEKWGLEPVCDILREIQQAAND